MTAVKEDKTMLMQSILEGEILSFFDLTAAISCFAEAGAVSGHKESLSVSPALLIAARLGAQGQLAPHTRRALPAAPVPSGTQRAKNCRVSTYLRDRFVHE